jgi:hypothetical protein
VGLLDHITATSLDADYAHVSERKRSAPGEGGQPSRSRAPHGLTLLVTVLFGALLATAAVQTARTEPVRQQSQESLRAQAQERRQELNAARREIVTLRRTVDRVQGDALAASQQGRSLRDQLTAIGVAAGTEARPTGAPSSDGTSRPVGQAGRPADQARRPADSAQGDRAADRTWRPADSAQGDKAADRTWRPAGQPTGAVDDAARAGNQTAGQASNTAPRVVNLRQYSEYRIVGRFAEAATANASATRNAMFCPGTAIPPMIASRPMTTTVRRATLTSPSGGTSPFLRTFA